MLNARESRWRDYGPMGFGCNFEGKRRFPQLGISVNVLPRGASLGLYHRESHQEDFLVLAGERDLVVEGEKRRLRALGLRSLRGRDGAHHRRCRRRVGGRAARAC